MGRIPPIPPLPPDEWLAKNLKVDPFPGEWCQWRVRERRRNRMAFLLGIVILIIMVFFKWLI